MIDAALAPRSESSDTSNAVIRTVDKNGPALFTILPAGDSPTAIAIQSNTP